MSKKRGRPCKDGNKERQYRLRMDTDEFELLNYMSLETGLSKADILRNALKIYALSKGFND